MLRIDNHNANVGLWTPLGLPGDSAADLSGDHLFISGTNVVVVPEHEMPVLANRVTLWNGALLTHQACTADQVYSLDLTVEEALVIDTASRIDATGRGYLAGRTTGNSTVGGATWPSGGSYGGLGAGSPANKTYGDFREPVEPGSGSSNVAGGGLLRITSGSAVVDGVIRANGANGSYYSPCGGSGGGILLNAGILSGNGAVQANGGAGYGSYGGGGGGRVALYAWDTMTLSASNAVANGGSGGGQAGTVHIGAEPYFCWGELPAVFHGEERVDWYALGVAPPTLSVDFSVGQAETVYPVAAGQDATGSAVWMTSQLPDGRYELRAVFFDASTQEVARLTLPASVNNSAGWHSGTVTTNETWGAGTVHIVAGNITVPAGVTLTIQPGAIVKFVAGAGVTLLTGGTLNALGTTDAPIIFTALEDDTAGGDTNLDGSQSLPRPWAGIAAQGGQFNASDAVDIRFLKQTHSGTLSASESWMANQLHVVSGDLRIPSGVTLTLNPGTTVKFEAGAGMTVQYGGRLMAHGTVAQPIILTSIKDDAAGGDSNADGDATAPMAGDWRSIQSLSTGVIDLRYVMARYGGNSTVNTYEAGGMIEGVGGYGTLLIDACTLSESLKDGILSANPTSITNSLITDCDRGVCAWGTLQLVNCTLDRNGQGAVEHGGTLTLRNCVVTRSLEFGVGNDYGTKRATVRHSNVWNPDTVNYSGIADMTGQNGNISADPNYRDADGGNFRLGYLSPCIDAADGTMAPASDFMGAPRYDDPRSPNTGLAAASGAFADMGAFEFVENAASDIDLIGEALAGPDAVTAGDTVRVQWRVVNRGSAPARGPWHDTVALAPANGGDVLACGDVLSGSGIVLGPGQWHACEAEFRVPGGTEGAYRWQVTVNSRSEVFEGVNRANNTAAAAAAATLTIPALTPGVTLSGLFSGAQQPAWFKVTQAAGTDMTVTLDAASADGRCRVYAGFDTMPGTQTFDRRSTEWNAPDARLGLTAPAVERTVYLLVMPETLPDGVTAFSLTAAPAAFGLEEIGLDRGGNAGPVTVPLRGAGFNGKLTAELQPDGGGAEIAAQRVILLDSANALATFPLGGAPAGLCDLTIRQEGLEATLADAFTVSAGTGGVFYARIVSPSYVRVFRPFAATVEFGNRGDADVPVPLLIVESEAGNPVWFGGLQAGAAETRSVLQFPAVGAEGIGGGVLRPGEHHSVTFYSKVAVDGYSHYSVRWIDGDNEDAQAWDDIKAVLRPADPPPQWDVAWAMLTQEIGPLVGDYIAALTRMEEALRGYGQEERSPYMLLWHMMDRALARFPGASLTGAAYDAATRQAMAGIDVQLAGATGDVYRVSTWFDGTFVFRDVPAGSYTLSAPEYLAVNVAAVTLPEETPLDLFVTRGVQVAGRVIDAAGGLPVSGAQVTLALEPDGGTATGITDEEGRYAVTGLAAGTYAVSCVSGRFIVPDAQTVTLASNTVYTLNWPLDTGGSLSGRVLSPGGAGVTGATVRVSGAAAGRSAGIATTEAGGLFTVSGLTADTYRVTAVSPDYGAGETAGVSLADGQALSGVTVSLTAATSITGRVTDAASGLPLAGAAVGVDEAAARREPNVTDDGGYFTLAGLAPGTQTVWCAAGGYFQQLKTVETAVGQTADVDFALRQVGRIAGRVVLDGGLTPTNMLVVLTATNGLLQTVTTGADGSFAFEDLTDGEYELSFGGLGEGLGGMAFTLGEAGNRFEGVSLARAGVLLSGAVLAADGTTLLGQVPVAVIRGGQTLATTLSDAQGRYAFYLLQTNVTVDVVAAGHEIGFAVAANIAIPASGSVVGQNVTAASHVLEAHCIRADGGAAVSNAWIKLCPDPASGGGGFSLLRLTDAAGLAVFSNLAARAYRVEAVAPALAAAVTNVTVSGVSQTGFVLTGGCVLQGTVRNAQGEPLDSVGITMRHTVTGQSLFRFTDGDGRYAIDSAAAGLYSLWFSDGRRCPTNVTATAAEGIPAVIDVMLADAGMTLSGRVCDDLGQGLGWARVSVLDGAGEILRTVYADADGRYELGPLDGAVTLRAESEGRAAETLVRTFSGEPAALQDWTLGTPTAIALDPAFASISGFGMTGVLALVPAVPGGPVPLGFMDWWNETSDWWTTWPRPERMRRRQGTFGGEIDDTAWWLSEYARIEAVDPSCVAYRNAVARAEDSAYLVDLHFGTWELSYDALKELNKTNLQIMSLQSAVLAGKVASFVLSVKAAGPALAEAGWDPKMVDFVLNAGGAFQNAAVNIQEAMHSHDFDKAEAAFWSLGDILIAITTEATDLPYIGPLWALINAGKELVTLGKEFFAMHDDNTTAIQRYKDARENYYEAVMRHESNTAAVRYAAKQDCPDNKDKCGECSGCTPNPCCDQPGKPCPPPCKGDDCDGGGGNGGGPSGTGSRDPNDKVGVGYGPLGFVAGGTPLTYTVYFENVPTSSAPAQVVLVTDQLDPQLDGSTLELGEIAFNNTVVAVPPGLQSFTAQAAVATDPNPVKVEASLSPSGLLTWTLTSVDPATGQLTEDPLAGFLPPNTTNRIGEGHVTYTVRPLAGLGEGAQITNQAVIVFDVNEPILTPAVTNTLDSLPPASAVAALPPVTTDAGFEVSWGGADAGAGVRSYTVYVSDNGAPAVPWLTDTALTNDLFTGVADHTYGFHVVASDHLGHQEAAKAAAEAVTLMRALLDATLDPAGGAVEPAALSVTNSLPYGPLPVPTRAGYSFIAWMAQTNGVDFAVDSTTAVTLNADHTLTAAWTANVYTVTFDAQGGSAAVPATTNVTFGSAYGALALTARASYIFGGWWTDTNETAVVVTSGTAVSTAADHTLYARWTALPPPPPPPPPPSGPATYLCGLSGDDPLETVGAYEGYLFGQGNFAGGNVSAVRGTLSVKVSKLTGTLTAKAALLKGNLSFSAKAWETPEGTDGTFGVTLTAKGGETLELLVRQNRISGSLKGGSLGAEKLSLDGARNRFADARDAEAQALLAAFNGYYTMALPPAAPGISASEQVGAAPEGVGYLALTIGAKGSAKVAGVLADGTKVSRAGRLLLFDGCRPDACVPLFAPLYGKKGWVGGLLWVIPEGGAVTTDDEFGWFLRWENPGKKGPDGFSMLLDVCGRFYGTGSALAAGYLFGADTGDTAYHDARGVAAWTQIPAGLPVAVEGGRMKAPKGAKPKKVTEEGVTRYVYDAVNPAGVTLSFASKSGIFKGKFSLYGEYDANGAPVLKAVSVPYAGILVPVRDGRFDDLPAGVGHCLIPDTDPAAAPFKLKRSHQVWLE